ncbi:DUF6878 family protein [Pelagibacterium sp.]|uniref:DUF6878 family protein n=1 Tax=Pelagibacterium sp. TaxID=1967288 RepID=UPI003BAD55F7
MTDSLKPESNAAAPLADWQQRAASVAQLEAELFEQNKTALLHALQMSGVTHVIVAFDGASDSGQIESVEVRAGDDDITMPGAHVEYLKIGFDASDRPEPTPVSVTLEQAIDRFAYDILERTHGGWENNDGAYGEFVFDVAKQAITLEHHDRYIAIESYNHTF